MRLSLPVLAVSALAVLAAGPAPAYGPDGFAFPRPDGGAERAAGGRSDSRYWSWFELGPQVCAGPAPRVFVRLGGQLLAIPCADFVDATISTVRPPAGWGRRADPIRAVGVAVILGRDPDRMLSYGTRGQTSLTWARRVRAALESGRCTDLGGDFLVCPQADWGEGRRLVVSAREADVLRGGARLALECVAAGGREYCAMHDWSAPDTGWTVEAVLPALDPELLAGFRPWSAAALAAIEGWSAR